MFVSAYDFLMRRMWLGALVLCFASCASEDPDWIGLYAGTFTEQQTNRASGEMRLVGPNSVSVRVEEDADGLYIDGDCDIPIRASSATRAQVLPTGCTASSARINILGGEARRSGARLQVTVNSRIDGSDYVVDAVTLYELTRTN